MLCDPPLWKSEIEAWERRYGDRVLAFETNQPGRMAPACDRFTTAINEATLTHDGTSALAQHIANMARRKVRVKDDEHDGRTRYVFVKAGAGKIDRGIAAVLAYEAASQIPKNRPRVWSFAALDELEAVPTSASPDAIGGVRPLIWPPPPPPGS
jgi:hypothetical protein